jgi:hypothetical protein
LIDKRIDFDQWEFCVVWATRISFPDVLSAVPPFLSHVAKVEESLTKVIEGGKERPLAVYHLTVL